MRTFIAILTMLAVACHFALGCGALHAHASGDEACAEHGHAHDHEHAGDSPLWPAESSSLPVESPTTCAHGVGCSAIVRARVETAADSEQLAACRLPVRRSWKPGHVASAPLIRMVCPAVTNLPFYLSGERLLI